MTTKRVVWTIGCLTALSSSLFAGQLGTSFTYQGKLESGGNPAAGTYDLTFSLYDATAGGTQIGTTLTDSAVALTDGCFCLPLDFGTGAFDGSARWLEIAVRTNGAASFVVLGPRQPLNAAPYALYAMTPAGPQGAQGPAGPQGANGAVGPQGPVGPTGATGLQGPAGLVGPTGATGAIGPAGPTGLTGATGATGPAGADGKSVLNGSGPPSTGTGSDGDFYLDTTANRIYGPRTAGNWGSGTVLVGPQGPQGATGLQGPAGPAGATGSIGPQGPAGVIGATGSAGPQGPQGPAGPQGATGAVGATGATGPAGADGKSLLNGSGAPSAGTGINGDFYLDTTAKQIYGPRTAGNWGSGTALVGPQGPQGATGPAGATGAIGPQGPAGATGATGAAGPQGLAGPAGATGAIGPAGATGPQGPAGLNWRGAWSGSNAYAINDAVSYQGSSYVATTPTTGVNLPGASAYWSLLAQQGGQGPAGATGPQGPQGPSGANGANGATGPQGPAGATGPQGPQGPAGTISANSVTSANLASDTASIGQMTDGCLWQDGAVDTFLGGSHNFYMSDKTWFLRQDQYHGVGWYGAGKTFAGASPDGPVLFGYGGGALGTDGTGQNLALCWNSSGKVGIGTASPNAPLQVLANRSVSASGDGVVNIGWPAFVSGEFNFPPMYLTFDGYQIQAQADGSPSNLVLNQYGGSVVIGSGSSSTYKLAVYGSSYSSGGWSGSDARWKKNVQPVTQALQKITRLQGVTYDWRRDEFPDKNFDEGTQLGFVAQDVEEVVPEAVRTDTTGYKAIAYEKLTAVLTEGVKEQQAEIKAQAAEIDSLKAQNAELKKRMAELDASVHKLLAK